MSQSLLGSLMSRSYCLSWAELIVFRYCFAKRLKPRKSQWDVVWNNILFILYVQLTHWMHSSLHVAYTQEFTCVIAILTSGGCSSPACLSSGSRTEVFSSWSPGTRLSSLATEAGGTRSWLALGHRHGNPEISLCQQLAAVMPGIYYKQPENR